MYRRLCKALAVLIAFVMLVSSVPMGGFTSLIASAKSNGAIETKEASASAVKKIIKVSSGKSNNFTYELYDDGKAVLTEYSGNIADLVIPDTVDGHSVAGIGNRLFRNHTELKSVTIPDSVTEIGDRAFEGCKALMGLDLPSDVRSIGEYILSGATGVKTITVPKTVMDFNMIDENKVEYPRHCDCWKAFSGSSVETVIFEDGLTYIPRAICFEAKGLKSVKIPDSVTEIGEYAFAGCIALPEIGLPDGIEFIGNRAFEGCKALKGLDLPSNVRSIGEFILSGATGVKTITVPKSVMDFNMIKVNEIEYPRHCDCWKAFSGSSVETVIFEDGLTYIPRAICFEAKGLKSVKIPDSVTEIGEYAFAGCIALPEIDLPDGIEFIGDRVFVDCEALKGLDLPSNVRSIGEYILSGATGIKTITVPKTVMDFNMIKVNEIEYPRHCDCWKAFSGSSVETVIFEDGLTYIPRAICFEAKGLKSVKIPDSVTEIGEYAFGGCINLEKIDSNGTEFRFSPNSFKDCDKLVDPRFTVLDLDNTCLAANSEQTGVNGIVNYTLKYKLTPSAAAGAKNIEIRINVPEGLTLLPDSIQSKNLKFDPEKMKEGKIPTESTEGELRFSVRVIEVGEYKVSALLHFDYNGSRWEQMIGRMDVDCPDITIAVPEHVNNFSAEVYGIAQKNQDVRIFVNDALSGTFTANGYTGKYKGSVSLPAGEDGAVYSLYAQCGDTKSDVVETVYSAAKPVVEKVIFRYNAHSNKEMDITDVFKKGMSPVVSYNPAYPVSFEITATNNDHIKRLFVTSTKGDVDKYIEAFYDADKGTWIAEGFFDELNHSYVPGALNISIIEKETIIIGGDDPEDDQKLDVPKEYTDNSSVDIISETEDSFLAEVNVSDGTDADSFHVYLSGKGKGLYINGEYYSAETIAKNPKKYGFIPCDGNFVENGQRVEFYVLDVSSDDIVSTICMEQSDILKNIKDIWTGKAILKFIEGDAADEPLFSLVNEYITSGAGDVIKKLFGDGHGDISKALSLGSDMLRYAAQLEMANGNVEYEAAATMLFALRCLNTFGTKAILAEAFPIMGPIIAPFVKWAIGKALDSVDSYLMDCIEHNRSFTLSGYIRFIIDPSGIVFEAVIGNPVEGATVTIYFKDPETGKTIKWNAEDYDQLNPLQTARDGTYLWDVPEGEWKVICEKDGYETIETDWMSIPPVRTDVNFSLVNKTVPELIGAELSDKGLTIKFSRFVDISTVTNKSIVLKGFTGKFTVTPQLLGENDKYADTFILNGDFADKATAVSATGDVVSYAGTPASNTEMKITKAAATTDFIPGDVDGDGEVIAKDARLALRASASLETLSELAAKAADVDGNGRILANDARQILRFSAKLQKEFDKAA